MVRAAATGDVRFVDGLLQFEVPVHKCEAATGDTALHAAIDAGPTDVRRRGEGGDLVHMEYKMGYNTHTVLVYRTQIHRAGLAANMLKSRQFTNQSGVSTKC